MDENAGTPRPADPAGIARRIAERSEALGIGEADLAARAGMAPRYLHHLVEAGPGFDPGGFLRLAAALGTTYRELVEGGADHPPGQSGGTHPVLVQLSARECWDRIGGHGVGHLALPAGPGPAVFPVNYVVDAGTIAYRTRPDGAAAAEPGSSVSFQVDRIDDRLSRGWSVLISGTAEHVEDPEAVRRLAGHPGAEPWAGGVRPLWVRIRPTRISGRSVGTR
ncbi:DNA-binding protein [Kitasatospora sp. NE20-6]|uniref:pyridoxamine 5'-phosphate oxidase family protein n=1 Tax=Kitasatospora sp. NE20-6 TaxID=2859066 RepID=UPI0034DC5429